MQINRAIDVIFIFDMFFQFFIMFEKDTTDAAGADTVWEMRLSVTSAMYLKSWFVHWPSDCEFDCDRSPWLFRVWPALFTQLNLVRGPCCASE